KPAPCLLAGTSTDPTGSALLWAIAVSRGGAAVGYHPRVRCLGQPRANSSSSAISSEKMPSASVMANPKIKLANCPAAADGFRIAAAKELPKMMPTPTPAPPMPMQAIPAPMYFAAVGSMRGLLFEVVGRIGIQCAG